MHPITIKTYLLTFISNFGIQAATVLQGMMLARILGVDGRGAYAAVLLWPTLFAGIGLFGTNISLSRYSAKKDEYASVFRTAFISGVATGSIVSLLCFFMLPVLLVHESPEVLHLSRIFVPYILLNHLILNLAAVYLGYADFKKFNFVFVIYYPIFLAGMLLLYYFKVADVRSFIHLTLLCNVIVILITVMQCRKSLFSHATLLPLWGLVKDSLPFGITGLIQNIILQVDRIIVLYCLGMENLGFYVVALSAGSALGSIGSAAGQVIFSNSARQKTGDGFGHIAHVFRILSVVYLILGIFLLLMMPYLLPLVYGVEFRPAVGTACLLIPGFISSSLSNLLEQSIRAQGVAFKGVGVRVGVLILMFILGMFCCRSFGLTGMAVAYLGAQFCGLLFLIGISVRHYQGGRVMAFVPSSADFIFLLNFVRNMLINKLKNYIKI